MISDATQTPIRTAAPMISVLALEFWTATADFVAITINVHPGPAGFN
jgi:hypothetical protein